MNINNAETIKKIQTVDLEMAQYFVDFCRKNDLLCYFCGGGCIGAVRHKGFIPWDDDLDFFMPRRDYERLKNIWQNTDKYVLLYPTKDYNDHNMFMTMRDRTTTMIKPYQREMDTVHGITVDIFPLDGYPDNKFKRKMQVLWGLVYQLFCSQIIPRNYNFIVSFAGKLALGIFRAQTVRYYIWHLAERQMSKYRIEDCSCITEICAGPKYMSKRYPKEIFSEAVFMDFEGTQMPVPVGYDQYLRIAFGNYMILPPREQRVPTHDAFVDTTQPYVVYKGIRYCVDSDGRGERKGS